MSGEVSGNASMRIAAIVRFFFYAGDETIHAIHFLLRKGAHVVVFFALAFCTAHSLKFYICKFRTLLLFSWAIASVYGIFDEIHQSFIPGRVMAFSDMLINSVGAFFGAALVCWWLAKNSKKS
jgi:VanZ family protein